MGFFDLLWGADYRPKDWSGSPLSVEEEPTCFVARDHSGQALPYVYFEDEPGRRLSLWGLISSYSGYRSSAL
jgi:hypothetical protein